MKRIRLGDKSGYCFLIVVISILFLIVIIAAIIKQTIFNAIIDIIALIVLYCLFLLSTAFVENWTWYIELDKNTLTIKAPFRTIRKYDKQELSLRFLAKNHWFRGVSNLEPCLAIGNFLPNTFCIERKGFKQVYDDYFLVILNSKHKLNTILEWFATKVELPDRESFQSWYERWATKYRVALFTEIQEYYDLIQQYNKTKD